MSIQNLSILALAQWKKIKVKIFFTAIALVLMCLSAVSSYNYGIQLVPHAHTRAVSNHARNFLSAYSTKEERQEYKLYLMLQKNETEFMLWDEWKLSKVFLVTISQLESENKNNL